MNINPYPVDLNGGEIEEYNPNNPNQMELTEIERQLLEKIPQQDRVNYLFHSKEKELEDARNRLYNKLNSKLKSLTK